MSYYKSRFKVGDVVKVRKEARSLAHCTELNRYMNRHFRITNTENTPERELHATGHVQRVSVETVRCDFSASTYSGYYFEKVKR